MKRTEIILAHENAEPDFEVLVTFDAYVLLSVGNILKTKGGEFEVVRITETKELLTYGCIKTERK